MKDNKDMFLKNVKRMLRGLESGESLVLEKDDEGNIMIFKEPTGDEFEKL